MSSTLFRGWDIASQLASRRQTPDLATWRPRLSIRARLTLAFALLLATMGALMLGAVYVFMRYVPTYAIVTAEPSAPGDATGAAPPEAPLTPTSPAAPPAGRASRATHDAVNLTLQSTADILNTLLLASVIALVLLTAIGAVIGWVMAGRMLRPLKAINSAAKLAAGGALATRLDLDGPHDEMRDLAETFDDMLTKLDLAFQAHQLFAANASHELRTPLATTKAMLDVALSDPDLDLAELRRVSERVSETNLRNIQIVESLLDLAEIDQSRVRRERINLDRTAAEAISEAVAGISERDLTVSRLIEPVEFSGDPVLVRRALMNLLDNAVRHNVHGGKIEVSVRSIDDWAEFRVSNTGPLMEASAVDSLREPFVRGAGRVASAPQRARGHGLGLAIVASVASAHGGVLQLSANEDGGMTAALRLPSEPTHPRASSREAAPAS